MTGTNADAQIVVDRYALRSIIGRGGAGAVWQGHDRRLGRPVAIKQILLNEQRSTRSRERARREARTIARLRTPGVVQLYDLVEDGPYAYLVMELVEAPSLSRYVRRHGPMAPACAAAACRSLSSTVAAIHRAGVVHRDIKPSNVLLAGPVMRLTDFGIALLGDDPTLTASGSVLGTPAYMAPEQASGQRCGPAADRYGLGATLYFAVEGRAPFEDVGSWETTVAVQSQPHRPGVRLGPLADLVDALLHKDPTARPSAAEIDNALARIADDTPPGSGSITVTVPPHGAAHDGGESTLVDPDPDVDERRADERRVDEPVSIDDTDDDRVGSGSEERAQLHRTILWAGAALLLLAIALVLLFLAVNEQPADVTAHASGVGIATIARLPWQHPNSGREPFVCNRSMPCGPSSSLALSSPR